MASRFVPEMIKWKSLKNDTRDGKKFPSVDGADVGLFSRWLYACPRAGLPDFSSYNISKRETKKQITIKYVYQLATKFWSLGLKMCHLATLSTVCPLLYILLSP
jgi:hypothetical protein